jgi:diacylglycerol kinase
LQQSINHRIDALITANEKSRALREAAASYEGNWRDILVFVCAVLFTIVWWNVSHQRANWLLMFIVLILLSTMAGLYAGRGVVRALRHLTRNRQSR